jgi:hypothetical protein
MKLAASSIAIDSHQSGRSLSASLSSGIHSGGRKGNGTRARVATLGRCRSYYHRRHCSRLRFCRAAASMRRVAEEKRDREGCLTSATAL